jgi:hypothetical protein
MGQKHIGLFVDEIKDLKNRGKKEWLILRDFNLIYRAEDKSNNRLNRRLMTRFKETLDDAQLMEVDLCGRAYTTIPQALYTNGC